MNDETKKVLLQTVRTLRAKGGMSNKEMKPVIVSIEKLIKKNNNRRIKKA